MTYGIPGFKLEKASVQRRVKMLMEAGMEVKLNTEVGKDITFEELCEAYDAVFIGIGAMQGRVLDYETYNTDNIYMAVPFLTNIQKKLEEKAYDDKYQVAGRRVMVIGGGDTAMDCVRTSIREGASHVQCIYRRDEANMPGSRKEVLSAKEEGVEFLFQTTPKNLIADESGKVIGAKFAHTELVEKGDGRASIIELAGTEHIIEADIIILALGFSNEKLEFLAKNGIETTEWGAIKVDDKGQTTRHKVFAGGDAVRGADLVVTAALDGREAAFNMLEFLFEEEEVSSS
jgi:glutamate synthase (NADPH/NADH) small chain